MRSSVRMWASCLVPALVLFGISYGLLPGRPDPTAPAATTRAAESAGAADLPNEDELPVDIKNVGHVRMVFHTLDWDLNQEREHRYLVRMGEKVFPAYEAILSDPEVTPQEVAGIFGIVRRIPAGHRRFMSHAVSRLTVSHRGLRVVLADTLGQIGGPGETSLLVALLSDEYRSVVYYAAKSLAAIGGPNEVVAMDVWLRGVAHHDDADIREHVKKCRDALKKRLESEAKDRGK